MFKIYMKQKIFYVVLMLLVLVGVGFVISFQQADNSEADLIICADQESEFYGCDMKGKFCSEDYVLIVETIRRNVYN